MTLQANALIYSGYTFLAIGIALLVVGAVR